MPNQHFYYQMSQKIITVDENGNPIGNIDKWEAHKKGILHKGFSVALFYNSKVILQIRKHPVFDKVIDITASSHPVVIKGNNQDEEEAVYNCLKREWNINKEDLTNFNKCGSIVYKAKDTIGFIEHEYCTFYSANIDKEVKPNMDFAYGYVLKNRKDITTKHIPNLAPWVLQGKYLL